MSLYKNNRPGTFKKVKTQAIPVLRVYIRCQPTDMDNHLNIEYLITTATWFKVDNYYQDANAAGENCAEVALAGDDCDVFYGNFRVIFIGDF